MPRRTDIRSILIPGSGPIVIGQACEFDYSGTQACKALRSEGYRTILVNSNPATIMTDPDLSDATYIEPLTADVVTRIIEKERPDAILPTVGGQTALNLTMELHDKGILEKYGIQLIGAGVKAIRKAESREEFKQAMLSIGMRLPESELCNDFETADAFRRARGLPLIIRPSFTLGGAGGGIAFTQEEFELLSQSGLSASPIHQILVEQSIIGWKEFELEVMRDTADNVVIVCSIENVDPMGVHTGDSITVAPQQTLTDKQYQLMRDAAIAIIREIGVDTGGSNIQFGVNPANGEMVVIEMNPRVSRSSALASKATGFPIAKIAALLAVGYTLDEIQNDITGVTPASFEPTIDYVVTKVPRFTFEKFPGSNDTLGSQMKSVGETMSIGRTFRESFQKAFRSLETDRLGYGSDGYLRELFQIQELEEKGRSALIEFYKEILRRPNPDRMIHVRNALALGEPSLDLAQVHKLTGIDPWFLGQIQALIETEREFALAPGFDRARLFEMKAHGFSDRQLAFLANQKEIREIIGNSRKTIYDRRKDVLKILSTAEEEVKRARVDAGIAPVYRRVDTCGGEFEAKTPYLYSTYEEMTENAITDRRKVIILGGGPNRIGQGIEFDYCCCHASFALKDMGIESIMVNSNPETVSTDYDTSDKLYFEPLTLEDVLHICEQEKPDGVILQFGGQTPLKLARGLEKAGVKILGTSPDSIDRAEDRDRFSELLNKLNLRSPENGTAFTVDEALQVVARVGYPCLVRPSYVLGGRAMAIVHNDDQLRSFVKKAEDINPDHPILIDRFLQEAIEIDVDALCDGKQVFVAGIMQHIEEAGVHSGDSACILPPVDLNAEVRREIADATTRIALELGVIGLINIQFALQGTSLFVLEVNPRASRTVPFVSKAVGYPLAGLATQVMCGRTIAELGLVERDSGFIAIKEAVLPFSRFPGADTILGPEMKSTGEVMGIAPTLGEAYYKAMLGAGERVPASGGAFFSVSDAAKPLLVEEARSLAEMGYTLFGTAGTCDFLRARGISIELLHKMRENRTPNPLEQMKAGNISLIINIPDSQETRDDSFVLRQEAIKRRILCVTTAPGARAVAKGLRQVRGAPLSVHSLQEIHGKVPRA